MAEKLDYINIYFNLLISYLFQLAKDISLKIDGYLEQFFGYSFFYGSKIERKLALEDQRYAHRVKILLRMCPYNLEPQCYDTYIWRHLKYESPESTLKNKNISLFGIQKHFAIFCITEEAVDIWDINEHPFAALAQWKHAKELVFLPIAEYHKLSNLIDISHCKLTFIFTLGRTGSTLLAKMLNRVPKVQVLAEPWVPMNILCMHQDLVLTHSEKLKYLENAIKLICFPYENCVVKLTGIDLGNITDLAKLFPRAKLIFSSRSPWPTIKSRELALHSVTRKKFNPRAFPTAKTLPFPVGKINPKIDAYKEFFIHNNEAWKYKGEDAIAYYALGIWHYMQNIEKVSLVIYYEDLIRNPQQIIAMILYELAIPQVMDFSETLSVLNKNSQEGIFVRASKLELSEERKDALNFMQKRTRKVFDIFDIDFDANASIDDVKQFLNRNV